MKQKSIEVELIEGEDLNIENMKERIVTKAWYDTARFNEITDVAVGIGMGTRTLYDDRDHRCDSSYSDRRI